MKESWKKIINKYIVMKIASGDYKTGMMIPSENQFAIKFNCSRITVRNALQVLVNSGVLDVKRGSGYFVSNGSDGMTLKKFSFSRNITNTDVKDIELPKGVGGFKWNKNDKIITICKKYYDKNGLLSIQYTYLNKEYVWERNNELEKKSITKFLAMQGSPIKSQDIEIYVMEGVFPKKTIMEMGWNRKPIVERITSYSTDGWIEKTIRMTRKKDFKISMRKNTFT